MLRSPIERTNAITMLRAGADVGRRLREAPPEAGRVHSVFARALNIQWHDGRLLTLQGPGPLLAPFAAELASTPPWRGARAGTSVWRRGTLVGFEGIAVDWQAAADADTSMPERLEDLADAQARVLSVPPAATAPALSTATGREARWRVSAGLRLRDPALFVAGARALLGLGEGLTPAGDDCLVGTLAVIHRFSPAWLCRHPALSGAVAEAATATTTIAREFVVHALAGRFAESIIALMTAPSVDDARRAAARLVATGATSGADTLAGIRLALAGLAMPRPVTDLVVSDRLAARV